MKFCAVVMMFLLFAAPVFAADIDGKWAGTFSGGPGGDVQISYTFKADGAKLTGTSTGPDGTAIAIKDGKIEGSNISFSVDIDFGGMPFTLTYKGVMKGDQIKLTMDMLGMPFEFDLKKEAPKK